MTKQPKIPKKVTIDRAATGDEDQCIERRISSAATVIDNYQWSRLDGGTRGEQIARALVNAGWTPPESEA